MDVNMDSDMDTIMGTEMDTPTEPTDQGGKQTPPTPISERTFTVFSALAPELRLQIWEAALPPRIVNFESSFPNFMVSAMTNATMPAVGRVNFETLSVAKRRGPLVVQGLYRTAYRMDPKVDTLRVYAMWLPTIVPTTVWPLADMPRNALPVQNLQCFCLGPTFSDYITRATYARFVMPLKTLDLAVFPVLKEVTLLYKTSSVRHWLCGYQVHGPEVVNQPDADSLWEWARRDGEYVTQAAPYFEQRGLRGDAGIRWPKDSHAPRHYSFPFLTQFQIGVSSEARAAIEEGKIAVRNEIRRRGRAIQFESEDPWNTTVAAYGASTRPAVGLMGYSQGAVSSGGQWAGFLYDVESKDLYFTPLAWSEVKDALEANREPLATFPDLLIRIFIVRPGQTAPQAPHYSWEKVHVFQWSETRDMKIIRALWQVAAITFNRRRFKQEKMRFDP
ncbi:Fc.00g037710.m01.CDS01 [Cosmosporella sp. VM-42]